MDSLPSLIVILIVLIICSAYFSVSEAAFQSASKIKLRNLANKGSTRAESVLILLERNKLFLPSLLVAKTIFQVGASTISFVLFQLLFAETGVLLSAVIMIVMIIIFTEILPKTIATHYDEQFAMSNISVAKAVSFVLKPLAFFFSLWEKLCHSFFKTEEDNSYTGEELITMIEEVEKDGNIDASEGELIISAIEFNEAEVQDIYTPRVDVVAVDVDWDIERIEEVFLNNPYSRLPIYEESIDNIIGFIHGRDLQKLAKTRKGTIKDIIQDPIRVSESMKISELLKIIQKNKSHLAIVIDEYGGTEGIVTLEDIIEELVGDIWDEHDEVIVDIEQISDNTYMVDGGAYVDDVFELLDVHDDTEYNANTMSGWISEHFNRIPEKGETIRYKNLLITIVDADDKTVDKLKVEYEVHRIDGEEK